jgi:hypothetical protein
MVAGIALIGTNDYGDQSALAMPSASTEQWASGPRPMLRVA